MITFKVPREHIWDFFKDNEEALQFEDALIAYGSNSELGITLSNFWKRPAFYVTHGKITKEIVPFTQDETIEVFDKLVEKYLSDDIEEEKSSEEIKTNLLEATTNFIEALIAENLYEATIEEVSDSTIQEILESAEETLFNNDGIIVHNPAVIQNEHGEYEEVYSIFESSDEDDDYEMFGG